MTETPASPDPLDARAEGPTHDEELDRDALHEEPTDPEATGAPVAGDLGPQEDAAPTSAASSTPDLDYDNPVDDDGGRVPLFDPPLPSEQDGATE